MNTLMKIGTASVLALATAATAPAYAQQTDNKRVRRWFNLDIDETDGRGGGGGGEVVWTRFPPLAVHIQGRGQQSPR